MASSGIALDDQDIKEIQCRHLHRNGEGHSPQLTLTLGLSLVLRYGRLILFGAGPQSVRTLLSCGNKAWAARES